jgi:hypothetical protein
VITAQRWTAVDELRTATRRSPFVAGGPLLDGLLLLLTISLFLAGLPLALDALGELKFLRVSGALRCAFVAVWAALLGLLGWQVTLLYRSIDAARHPPPSPPKPRVGSGHS